MLYYGFKNIINYVFMLIISAIPVGLGLGHYNDG